MHFCNDDLITAYKQEQKGRKEAAADRKKKVSSGGEQPASSQPAGALTTGGSVAHQVLTADITQQQVSTVMPAAPVQGTLSQASMPLGNNRTL